MVISTRWRKSSFSGSGNSNCVEVACWRKSSYSGGSGQQCVEIGAWRKSSRSNGSGQACVEIGAGGSVFGVRDTKDRSGGTLTFDVASWTTFVTAVRSGQFDL